MGGRAGLENLWRIVAIAVYLSLRYILNPKTELNFPLPSIIIARAPCALDAEGIWGIRDLGTDA